MRKQKRKEGGERKEKNISGKFSHFHSMNAD